MRTQTHTGHVVLPTTLLPTLLTDAASLLTDSATSTVQDAMLAYQQAMLLLVRWYEAGQLEGRGGPTSPPAGGMPPVIAASPAQAIVTVRRESAPAAAAAAAAEPTPEMAPTMATPAAVCIERSTAVGDTEPPSATVEPDVSASGAAEQPETAPQPAHPDIAPRARSAARPLLPPSAPPLEAPPPSDALGHAARRAITRRYGPDVTDPGAQAP